MSEFARLTVTHEGLPAPQLAPPTALPTDLVPGEFINDGTGWWVFYDKQRFWDGRAWRLTGSIELLPPDLPEAEQYALRNKLLRRAGWIG